MFHKVFHSSQETQVCMSKLYLSYSNHIFYFLSLVATTSRIHVFSSCIQQGANNLLTLPSLYFLLFLPFASTQYLNPFCFSSLSLTQLQRIPHTVRVSPKSCQNMFCCQRDAEWERIRYRPWCVPDKKQAN